VKYLRHVTHEICSEVRCQNGAVGVMVMMKPHEKYINHAAMSNTVPSLRPDWLTKFSRQLTSCLVRLATMTSYSFKAADENARFQGLR